ncbi:glycosyltransferase [Dyella solisilvae]|uniref:Glycosyltransferase n=1 Tax=Dyella solisilvae TaxID=1920168 RepID=A0A370K8U6_9GAMM|nr:glycosyltransferase [Dyella solisilvae]RDI99061.1 glycosyltransferase [Dyella solisilvae]
MPQLSVVVPVFNERDNIPPLLAEIAAALRGRIDFEIVYVDDDSSDDSVAVLAAEKPSYPELRIVRHLTRSGQSTAVWNGVRAARSPWIATLDGDGQNDPADIPKLLASRDSAQPGVRLFAGWRTTRRDSFNKRISSKIANAVRSRMLQDSTPDTGCGLKLFDREVFLRLPYFDHMHRYLPALVKRAGFQSTSVPVGHRPRTAGTSKYGMLDRLWVGIADLRGVAWLMRRGKVTQVEEI